jgi:hypothetical protein
MNRLTGPLLVLTLLFILLGTAMLARAQDTMPGTVPNGPPAGSLSLSQIIVKVEGQPDFGFVQQVNWQDGAWRISYRTKSGDLRVMQADARTGVPHTVPQDGIPKDGVLPPPPAQMPAEKHE